MANRKRRGHKHRPKKKPKPKELTKDDPEVRPDYSRGCSNCGDSPIVPVTGMCGPCTFGEAETAGGNW